MPRKHRRLGLPGPGDTLVSQKMLEHAMAAILARARLDREHDIPYLAGYSRDGKTIYIDRHIPKGFRHNGRYIATDRFLILHESVEKALLHMWGLIYQHAHQIALRAEQAAVRAAGVRWQDYDRFMMRYVKEAGDEKLRNLPIDLDLKPYRDEQDMELLRNMQAQIQRERQRPLGAKRRRS